MRFPLMAVAALALQLSESIEVRVINVDVVVSDRDGKPVTGLTKDDFEVFEDKKPQVITNFYEVRGGVPAGTGAGNGSTALLPRSFILFIDNRAMHPVLRKQVTAEMAKFVDTAVGPNDQVSVVIWDGTFRILTPLTNEKAAVRKAIDTVARTGTPMSATSDFQRVQAECTRALNMGTGREYPGIPIKLAYDQCIGSVRIETQRMTMYSRLMLNAVEVAMSTVAGVEGRKVLVLAGTELPARPGQDMYQWANGRFQPYMRGFDAAIEQPPFEYRDQQRAALESIAKAANANGVTLYPISALMPVDVNSTQNSTGIDDAGAGFLRSGNTDAAHELLARMTGGTAAPVSQMPALLDTLRRDLDSYYSLGYRPGIDQRGDRPVAVRAKNRAYTVRARQSYASRTSDEQMRDRAIANIYTPARVSDWKFQLRTGKPKAVKKGEYSLPIELVAPPSVTLLPRDGKLAGGFVVYIIVGNARGALSATFRQANAIEITPAEEAGFRRTPLTFGANLTIREGENLISVGLVDQAGGTMGFARTTVTASAK
jgi:VWFA-related protein